MKLRMALLGVCSPAMALALAACGGEDNRAQTALSATAAAQTLPSLGERVRAMATAGGSFRASAVMASNGQFFLWATLQFPDLFPAHPQAFDLTADGMAWEVREFSNGNYLAVASNGRIYALGPATGNVLLDLGALQPLAGAICSKVDCSAGTGPFNGCTLPGNEWLRAGNVFSNTYVGTTLSPVVASGEFTTTTTVNGPATFDAQSSIKSTTQAVNHGAGGNGDALIVSYSRAAPNSLLETLGAETDITIQGDRKVTRTAFKPYALNSEFTLQPGMSMQKTVSSTVTSINATSPPSVSSSTTIFTYEARETITVLGRTYESCRYKELNSSSNDVRIAWYIVGTGVPARDERRDRSGTLLNRIELKSSTLNGSLR